MKNVSGRFTAIMNANEDEKLEGIQPVNVVELAYRPAEPLKPNKPLILIFGLFLGLVLGAGWVLVRHMLQRPSMVRMLRPIAKRIETIAISPTGGWHF